MPRESTKINQSNKANKSKKLNDLNELKKLSTDDLIDKLYDAEKDEDHILTKKIYKIICKRDDAEGDFWRECFYESAEWVIRIIASVKKPLTIHDTFLIKNFKLFKEIMETYEVDTEGYDAVLENLEDDDDITQGNLKKIKYIRKKCCT